METGVDMDVGTDLKSVVDTSGNVGVAVCVVMGVVTDAGVGTGSMMAGTDTRDNVGAAGEGQAGTIPGLVPSACVAVSGVSAPANVQLGIVMPEIDMAVGFERDVVVEVHSGMSPETVGVTGLVQGVGVGTETVAVVCAETVASVMCEWM